MTPVVTSALSYAAYAWANPYSASAMSLGVVVMARKVIDYLDRSGVLDLLGVFGIPELMKCGVMLGSIVLGMTHSITVLLITCLFVAIMVIYDMGKLIFSNLALLKDKGFAEFPKRLYGSEDCLDFLNLRGNFLTSIPADIGQFQRLRILDLSNNRLTEIPPDIGLLWRVRLLNLRHNRLQTIPDCFGNLRRLERLDLSNNRLTTLPDSVLSLPRGCVVSAVGNNFSAETVPDLTERRDRIRQNDPTRGPELSFSVRSSYVRRDDLKPQEVFKAWFERCNVGSAEAAEKAKNLETLLNTNDDETTAQHGAEVAMYLERMADTSDYKSAALKPVIHRIMGRMLQEMIDNASFRTEAVQIIFDALQACDDRVTRGYVDIELQLNVSEKGISAHELATRVIGGHRRNLLTHYAKEAVKEFSKTDHLEVELFYLVKLKKALKLPISIKGMTFTNLGQVPDGVLKRDARAIYELTKTVDQRVDILTDSHAWQEDVKRNHQAEVTAINERISEEIDQLPKDMEAGKYAEACKQLQAKQQREIRELVKTKTHEWVLANQQRLEQDLQLEQSGWSIPFLS